MLNNLKKRTQTVVLLSVLLAGFPAFADWGGLSAEGPLPIDLDNAPGIFKQCSRQAPTPSQDVWLPSQSEVYEMEQQLNAHLASVDVQFSPDPSWSAGNYRGYHVGFNEGDERYIYASYLDISQSTLDRVPEGDALLLCDGGLSSWGIVYNLRTGEFSDFQVNGR